MSVISVTKENFNQIKNSDKTVLLDFYADWCGPCRMVSPIVDEIAQENPQYLVGKINVDEQPELAAAFNGGKTVNQSVGARPKSQILAMLED